MKRILCRDCYYYSPHAHDLKNSDDPRFSAVGECRHPLNCNPVSGKLHRRTCIQLREDTAGPAYCGIEAKWFENRAEAQLRSDHGAS